MNAECLICEQEKEDGSQLVFADAHWAAGVIRGYDVPGWVTLRVRRHAVGFHGLNAEELASFGRRSRDLVAAVREVTGASKCYLMIFGEANPHFHALITPRTEDVPANQRLGDILHLREARSDLAASKLLLPRIRDAYQRFAAETVAP